jgi:hypothetical protein
VSGWWYLSFADDGWLGAAIVEGDSIVSAAARAHALGINPGGEVLGVELPAEALDEALVGEGMRNVLLTEEMMREAGWDPTRVRS